MQNEHLQNLTSMVEVWIEVERLTRGTNHLEQFFLSNMGHIPTLVEWRSLAKEDNFKRITQFKADHTLQLDYKSSDTPQNYDAGTLHLHNSNFNFGRFIYYDGEWWALCDGYDWLTQTQINEIRSNYASRPSVTLDPNESVTLVEITNGWRYN